MTAIEHRFFGRKFIIVIVAVESTNFVLLHLIRRSMGLGERNMEARHSRSVFIKTPGVVALVPVSSSIAFYFSLPRPPYRSWTKSQRRFIIEIGTN